MKIEADKTSCGHIIYLKTSGIACQYVNFGDIQDMIELYAVSYFFTRASYNIPSYKLRWNLNWHDILRFVEVAGTPSKENEVPSPA